MPLLGVSSPPRCGLKEVELKVESASLKPTPLDTLDEAAVSRAGLKLTCVRAGVPSRPKGVTLELSSRATLPAREVKSDDERPSPVVELRLSSKTRRLTLGRLTNACGGSVAGTEDSRWLRGISSLSPRKMLGDGLARRWYDDVGDEKRELPLAGPGVPSRPGVLSRNPPPGVLPRSFVMRIELRELGRKGGTSGGCFFADDRESETLKGRCGCECRLLLTLAPSAPLPGAELA